MQIVKTLLLAASLTLTSQLSLADTEVASVPPIVNLNKDIVIRGDIVYLNDIFSGLNEEDKKPIARSPALGQDVELSARWLWALAQQNEVNWQPNSHLDTASVTRESQLIDAVTIRNSVESALLERDLTDGKKIVFDRKDRDLHIPAEVDATIRIENVSYRPGRKRFTAQIVIPATGKSYITKAISGNLIEMVNVPVLRNRLSKGDIIGPQDIHWITIEESKLNKNAITDLDGLIGMTPKHSIKDKIIIRTSDLDTPKAVNKNGLVTMLLNSGPLILRAQGRALESGAVGQVIRLMNTQSNTIVNGTVTGSGLVTVSLISQTITGN
ncbi:flagellar basal body P-ring formation chaperone FlgA [Kiloniella antarctica]|uniref:Flagellar basal body P-ring formation chaperone FlgA n=1 Tax=Kiloniella antarctica TaxID=1550907 RepID=A0ABW5BSR8_9PROT